MNESKTICVYMEISLHCTRTLEMKFDYKMENFIVLIMIDERLTIDDFDENEKW